LLELLVDEEDRLGFGHEDLAEADCHIAGDKF
jgi:hypothetical protein